MSSVQPKSAIDSTTNRRFMQRLFSPALRRFLRSPSVIFGLIVLLVLVLAAIFAPLLTPYHYSDINPRNSYAPPSLENPFGTDKFGRDVFTRVLYGGRYSLRIGLIAVAIGGGLGLFLGMLAGYLGGWIDEVIMRILDVMLAFPGILLAMAVVSVLGPGLTNLMIAVGVSQAPGFARLVRSTVLSAKENDYVMATRALGGKNKSIMWRHILPNVAAPIIVVATLNVALAILAGSTLNFLGLGAKPPIPEWGLMLSDGRQTLNRAWWVSVFPGLTIMAATLSINFVGDGLRSALDPRLRE